MRHDTPDISKDRKYWKRDRQTAEQRLAELGGQLTDSPHAYEMWRWVHPDLTLIFYPHRTSAHNYHCRVRAGQCTNRETLRKAIYALAENTCTFQFPTERKWHNEGVMASIRREREAIEAKATKRRAAGVGACVAPSTVREFTNELGNRIRITIEGPTSTSENVLTPMEARELRQALDAHSVGACCEAQQAAVECVFCKRQMLDGSQCLHPTVAAVCDMRKAGVDLSSVDTARMADEVLRNAGVGEVGRG